MVFCVVCCPDLQYKYFIPDPIKNDVKYQVRKRILPPLRERAVSPSHVRRLFSHTGDACCLTVCCMSDRRQLTTMFSMAPLQLPMMNCRPARSPSLCLGCYAPLLRLEIEATEAPRLPQSSICEEVATCAKSMVLS